MLGAKFSRLLNDLPIAAKTLVASLVSAAAMLGIVILVLISYRNIDRANALGVDIAHTIEHAMSFTAELDGGHTALYSAISLKSQRVDVPVVRDKMSEALAAWSKAGDALTSLEQWVDSSQGLETLGVDGVASQRLLLADARKAFEAYVVIGKEAAGFVEADAFVATMYMTGAEPKYASANGATATIIAVLNANRAHIEQNAADALRRAVYEVGSAALATVLLSLVVTVSFARLISRPIRATAQTMRQLAAGELDIVLPNTGRRDEIGTIAVALHTLRDSAVAAAQAAVERQHSQKLEALGTLAGGIAHDLNNALVPVLALSKTMAHRLPPGSRDRATLEMILHGAERGRDLVKQILAFSRKEQAEKLPVDLGELVLEALKMMRASIPSTVQIAPIVEPVPMMIGDAVQLQQVLVNLVTNAAHAIGGAMGAITVRVSLVSSKEPQGCGEIVLSVEDTGAGMDEAVQRRIFDPFFTTKSVGEGTGLGLSVVHGIVVAHGGRIKVMSRPGAGSRFDVSFPEAPKQRLEVAAA